MWSKTSRVWIVTEETFWYLSDLDRTVWVWKSSSPFIWTEFPISIIICKVPYTHQNLLYHNRRSSEPFLSHTQSLPEQWTYFYEKRGLFFQKIWKIKNETSNYIWTLDNIKSLTFFLDNFFKSEFPFFQTPLCSMCDSI